MSEVVVITPAELDALIRRAVREALSERESGERWLDTKAAAAYLGCHPVTLRRLAAEGEIDFAQDGPGRKMFFSTRVLDRHRQGV